MSSFVRKSLAVAMTGALMACVGLTASAQPKPNPKAQARLIPSSAIKRYMVTTVSLNTRVLQFAQSKIGQTVGRGECWDLANEALAAAGAKQPGRDGYATYVFGSSVNLNSVRAGDILQFENVNFKHTNSNGSWYSNSFPHHTAVVRSVGGGKIEILHQNVNGDRHVQAGTIILADRQAGGSLLAYRPQPR